MSSEKKHPFLTRLRVTWTTSGHYWLLLGIETHLDTDTFYQLTKAKKKSVGFATKYIYIYQSHNSLKSNCAFIKFCYTQWLDYIFAVRIKANNILRKSRVCFHKYVYVKVTTSCLPNHSNIFFSCTCWKFKQLSNLVTHPLDYRNCERTLHKAAILVSRKKHTDCLSQKYIFG